MLDGEGRLVGSLPVVALVKAAVHTGRGAPRGRQPPAVTADADLPEIARLMTDFNLIVLPVVDGDGMPIGVLAVDDVLEQMLPEDWRRRYGAARE